MTLALAHDASLAEAPSRIRLHGVEVAYRMAGRGPVLLLVHGMAGSSATWRHVIPALAEHHTVIAPDLLGHGDSGKPRSDYSVGAHANVMRDLLNALGVDRATCIGQSLGGGVVLQLAYQFPERCERLVLVGSGGLGPHVSHVLRLLSAPLAEPFFTLACNRSTRALAATTGRVLARLGARLGPAGEEVWASYASLADAPARRAFFRTLRAVIDLDGQAVAAADKLYLAADLPTLIVWGDADPFIPHAHGLDAHAVIEGSRLEIFPGVGHYPHCEAPARFVEVVTEFLARTDAVRISERAWRERFRDQRTAS